MCSLAKNPKEPELSLARKMPGSQILKDFTDFWGRRDAQSSIGIQKGPPMFPGFLTSLLFSRSHHQTTQHRFLLVPGPEPMVSAAAQMLWMTMSISVPKAFSL